MKIGFQTTTVVLICCFNLMNNYVWVWEMAFQNSWHFSIIIIIIIIIID